MTWRREHTIIFMIEITEVLGFSLVLPFLPFYAQQLGATPFQVGLILASFSLFQFISTPIIGKLSDTFGRKKLLILSQLSTLISFIILAFARNLWILLLSRIIDGLLGSNYIIAQTYLSDITPKKDLTQVFSFTGIAFSIGLFVGPAIGGYLAQFSYSFPAFLAALIASFTILTTYLYLPESIRVTKKFIWKWDIVKLQQFKILFTHSKVTMPLWELFTYQLTNGLWISSFALYAERQLGFKSQDIGYMFAIIGIVNIVIRMFVLPKLIQVIKETNLRITGATSIIIALFLTSLVSTYSGIIFAIILFSFGDGLLRPSLTSHISKQAHAKKQGEVMGITESLSSISQIIGPLVGGYIIENYLPGVLGITTAMIMTFGLILMITEAYFVHPKRAPLA